MADGIKIRALNVTTTVKQSDVLIVDKLNSITNENITYQISVDNFAKGVLANPENNLENLPDVIINNPQQGDVLTYDGNYWVNLTPTNAGEFKGDCIVFNSSQAPVVFKVTVGDRTEANRFYGDTTSVKSYYIDGVEAPPMVLAPGRKYIFDQSDESNAGYDLRFYTTPTNTGFISSPYSNDIINDVTINGVAGQPGSYTELFITQKYELDLLNNSVLIGETAEKLFYNVYGASPEDLMGNSILNIGRIEEGNFDIDGGGGILPVVQQQITELQLRVQELQEHLSRLIEIE